MTTNVVETESTRAVVTDNPVTNIVEVTSAGPAGPAGSLTIQDQGVSEGLLTDKLNFAGSTVSVVNDTVNEIATVTVNAATPGANTNITSLGGITGGISSPDFIQFDTAAAATGAVGRMLWNDTDGTLEFQMKGGNVTLQVGQEQVLRVTNQSGATMVDGQVVYITGSTGNHLNVTLSQANSEMTSSKTLAVVTETIANNQSGFATTSGLVRNFNTSALTEGEAIWLSPTVPGGLTSTKPVAPNHAVLVGWCVRQHASVGVIYVHIANGYELQELHNVLITAVANNQVLRYDSATSLWKNVTISPTVTLTGAVTGSGTMTDLGSVSIATTATADPTLTLAGDATGSATFTNLGDATLTVTVVDDSHNHIISNVDGLQDALDLKAPLSSPTFTGTVTLPSTTSVGTVSATEISYLDGVTSGIQAQLDSKLPSASYTAADVLTKIKTVDGVGSGLDADLLDGESGAYYLDFTNATNKPDPTITLSGDATGSVTLTDLASGTLSVTVVDDSHNHVISNVDGLQDALDSKLAAADYTAADVLTKIKTVDGAGSGLDADLLDGQSSAYYTAINDRLGYTAENAANKGVANGYASLDGAGLVPSTQLPSYVDDVVEYANVAAFPATGESGKIYVAIDTSKTYRWTGSVYVEISASPGTTDSLTEGSVNLYFTTARARQSVSAGTGISYDNSTGVITNSSPDQTVALTAGTGISTSGTYPNFTITNSAPDQTVALSAGTGISTSGTYPNFTITNSAPDQTVALTAGTGISTSGAYPNFTITNSAPDQTVALTGSGTTSISGTYPNFTVSSADQYVGTVTSVAALTLGTTGTDLSSSVANGTTTPVITLNVPTASATNRGALSSTDWSAFNGKQAALVSGTNIKTVNGTTLLGSGDLGTIGVAYGGTGATTLSSGYLVKGNGTSAVSASVVYDDGTNVGIGTASPGSKLDVTGKIKSTALDIGTTAGQTLDFFKIGSANYIWAADAAPILIGTSNTERMRLDASGNLGLGVTPSAWDTFKTAQVGNASIHSLTTGNNSGVTSNAYYQTGWKYISSSANATYYQQFNGQHIWFNAPSGTAGAAISFTQAMTLDASGRLLIGTTTGVGSDFTSIRFNSAGSYPQGLNMVDSNASASATNFQVFRKSDDTYLGNIRRNGTDNALLVNGNSYLALGSGDTERMRIDSSGNVGIGTSSPAQKLDVNGTIQVRTSGFEFGRILTNNVSASTGGLTLQYNAGGTFTDGVVLNGSGNVGIGTGSPATKVHALTPSATSVAFRAGNSVSYAELQVDASGNSQLIAPGGTQIFNTNGAERMRITSSGNVGIGTSSPAAALDVVAQDAVRITGFQPFQTWRDSNDSNKGFRIQTAGGATLFSNDSTGGGTYTERMRIDSSGNLLVGKTSTSTSVTGFVALPTGFTATNANSEAGDMNRQSSDGTLLIFRRAQTQVGSINVSTTATTYNTTSDERLKENIENANSASDVIDAIQVRQFDWKSDGSHQRYGFVAQELVTVAPEAVYQPQDEDEMMAVDYSKLVPMLVKELQSVRARLAELEGK